MATYRSVLAAVITVGLSVSSTAQFSDTRWWLVSMGAIRSGAPANQMCQAIYSPEDFARDMYSGTRYLHQIIPTKAGYLHVVGSDLRSFMLAPTIDSCLDIARKLTLKEITEDDLVEMYLLPKEADSNKDQ